MTLLDRLLGRGNGNGHKSSRTQLALRDKRAELLEGKARGVTQRGPFGWSDFAPLLSLDDDIDVPSGGAMVTLKRKCSIISSAIEELAASFAQAPLQIGMETEDDFEAVEEHPLLDLFYQSPDLPYAQLMGLLVSRLTLTGICACLRGKYAELGMDAELTPLPSHAVSVSSVGPRIVGWSVQRGAKEPMPVKPEEMLAVWYPDPGKYVGWASPLAAAGVDWAIDQQRGKLTREILKNRNVPGGFLGFTKDSPLVNLGKDARKQLVESMDEQTGAETGRRGRLMFLPAGLQYTRGQDVSDVDLTFIATMSETRICAVLGVPPILLGLKSGLDRSTYANYGEARQSFYKETMVPLWRLFEESFTRQLLQPGDGLAFRFDRRGIPELEEDIDKRSNRAVALFGGGLAKLDEARGMVGLPPIGGEEGEAFKAPPPSPFAGFGGGEEEERTPPGRRPPPGREEEDEERRGKALAPDQPGRQGAPAPLESVLLKEFRAQRRELLKLLDGKHMPLQQPADWDARLAAAARPALTDLLLSRARSALKEVKGKRGPTLTMHGKATFGTVDASLEFIQPEILAMLDERIKQFARKVNRTTWAQIEKEIAAVTEAARVTNTLPDLAKAVNSVFEGFAEYRAWRVAVTESNRAATGGRVLASAATGQVKGYKVNVRPDACEVCQHYTAAGEPTGVPVVGYVGVGQAVQDAGTIGKNLPPFHVSCVVAETPVLAPNKRAAFVAPYSGPIVDVLLSDGRRLSVTPNHMLLTPDGFAAAQTLRKGDYVIDCSRAERIKGVQPQYNQRPAPISEVVRTFAESPGVSTCRVPFAAEDLHGDARFAQGKIEVVLANSLLREWVEASPAQRLVDHDLQGARPGIALLGESPLEELLLALRPPTDSGMSGRRDPTALLHRTSNVPSDLCRMVSPDRHVALLEAAQQHGPAHAQAIRDAQQAFPRLIGMAKIVDVNVRSFAGHVYDLQSHSSLYSANGIVSSNCLCAVEFVFVDEATPRQPKIDPSWVHIPRKPLED